MKSFMVEKFDGVEVAGGISLLSTLMLGWTLCTCEKVPLPRIGLRIMLKCQH